ncbi:hypothetical protein Syun_005656 [Stephania yunnanensis]|uniref:Uncharacterized protein n=1 Tax=Stephania yunnanensis TaxID=152371 RepID=A0AAP0Q3N3_9MAGN
MSSLLETFQKPSFFPSRPFNDSLPVSSQDPKNQQQQQQGSIRRRLSSISMKIQRPQIPSSQSSWEFIRRSKSLSSMKVESAGNSIRKWWDWGWGWILSRKPTFARDLEMNEEETAMLGCQNKGSWKHVIYKVRFELRKLVGYTNVSSSASSPVFAYDSYSYKQNFDDGNHSRHG